MQNNQNPWDVYFCTYMGNPNLRGFWKILIFDDFAAIQQRQFFFSIYGSTVPQNKKICLLQ